ncbi:MAG: addiction module toxin, HicA family [Chitinivibrionales bacterium]|nr:addiction module toxin, HicA family [Chitinivibrionales bacterium]
MNGKQLVKRLEKEGWTLARIAGSHHVMVKEGKRSVPVPVHGNRDIPKGLIRTILKQAEIKDC